MLPVGSRPGWDVGVTAGKGGWSGVGGARDTARHPTAHRPVPGGPSEPGVRAGGQLGTPGGRPVLTQRSQHAPPASMEGRRGAWCLSLSQQQFLVLGGLGGAIGREGPPAKSRRQAVCLGVPCPLWAQKTQCRNRTATDTLAQSPGAQSGRRGPRRSRLRVSPRPRGDLRCCAPWVRAGQGGGGHTAGAWPGQRTRVAHAAISAGRFLVPTLSARGSGLRGPAGPAVVSPEKRKVSGGARRPQQSPAHSEKTSVSPCIFILLSIDGIFSNGGWEMDLVFKKYVDFGYKVQRNVTARAHKQARMPAPPLSADCGPEHDPPPCPSPGKRMPYCVGPCRVAVPCCLSRLTFVRPSRTDLMRGSCPESTQAWGGR